MKELAALLFLASLFGVEELVSLVAGYILFTLLVEIKGFGSLIMVLTPLVGVTELLSLLIIPHRLGPGPRGLKPTYRIGSLGYLAVDVIPASSVYYLGRIPDQDLG